MGRAAASSIAAVLCRFRHSGKCAVARRPAAVKSATRCCILAVLQVLLFVSVVKGTEVREFLVGGTSRALSEAPAGVQLILRGMRFNEISEQWNVDLIVTNRSTQTFSGIIVVAIDGFTGTIGPLRPDGISIGSPSSPFFQAQLPSANTNGIFAPGAATQPRTIALGFVDDASVPQLTTKVFVQPVGQTYALALTRTLDDLGQPLPGVLVHESSAQGQRTLFSDSEYGVVTLGQGPGEHTWRFDAAGHLPVWRDGSVPLGNVRLIPDPRLPRRSTNTVTLSAGAVTQFVSAPVSLVRGASSITLAVPMGALSGDTAVMLTAIDGQSLPGLLPQGWSPMGAFWLELSRDPAQPLGMVIRPAAAIAAGQPATFARWDTNRLQWVALATASGNGSNALTFSVSSSGAYALVVPDTGLLAPAAAITGQPLLRSTTASPATTFLAASGSVTPGTNQASRVSDDVTAVASVRIASSNSLVPSGFVLRCDTREDYRLQDGSARFTPHYENYIVAYQQPGDGDLHTVHAVFPVRPVLLLGAEELASATVTVDVLPSGDFTGGVFEPAGNFIEINGVRLTASAGTFDRQQAALIRTLSPATFSSLTVNGMAIQAAVDVTVAAAVSSHPLSMQFSNIATNQQFVLARIPSAFRVGSSTFVEPVERLVSDGTGVLSTLEPATGDRLPGVTASGIYLLFQAAGQTLVTGVVRDSGGHTTASAPVRATGQPWFVSSDSNGVYRLVAPTGAVQIVTSDATTGNTAIVDATATDPSTPLHLDLSTVPHGPRVLSVAPADGTRNVPRVAAVTVTFSKPVNPATLLNGGLQLLGTNGSPVAASLSLDLRSTTATLLPVNPLAASTLHVVALGTNVADLNGLTLEGPTLFTFTTESDLLNRPPAQLTSYEPTNGVARLVGGPGMAEPNAPVILVNETSGTTETVLSLADGSFSNSIPADVDDLLSAVIINANGTRNVVPVSRQVFLDGSIGLFKGGGILEAESDGGSVQVIVEPGSVPNNTRFNINALSTDQLQAVLNGLQPANGGKVLQGFNFSATGDQLTTPADVRMSVDPATLGAPAGVDPTNGVYALARETQVNGVRVFEIIDKMEFKDGFLETHSPPFPGLGSSPSHYASGAGKAAGGFGGSVRKGLTSAPGITVFGMLLGFERRLIITGKFLSGDRTVETNQLPVAGGVVFGAPASVAGSAPLEGQSIAVCDANGHYSLLLTIGPDDRSVRLTGVSDAFPGKIGAGFSGVPD